MVHLERIFEEIRILNIKDETLLSFRIFQNFSTNCGRIQRSFLEFTRRCRFLENIFITEMAMSTEMLSSTVYRLQLDEICLNRFQF